MVYYAGMLDINRVEPWLLILDSLAGTNCPNPKAATSIDMCHLLLVKTPSLLLLAFFYRLSLPNPFRARTGALRIF